MSNVYTLANYRKVVEEKYAPVRIQLDEEGKEVLELIPALRLPKEKREQLSKLQASREKHGEGDVTTLDDLIGFLQEYVRVIGSDKRMVDKLLKTVGDDAAILSEIISDYSGDTEAGEASTSDN